MTSRIGGLSAEKKTTDSDYARFRQAMADGVCPECGKKLTPCLHTEHHAAHTGHMPVGDCEPCSCCWTLGPLRRPEGMTEFSDKNTRVSAALASGVCPDCGNPLTPCQHQQVHLDAGDDHVFGDCNSCRCCWTYGVSEAKS